MAAGDPHPNHKEHHVPETTPPEGTPSTPEAPSIDWDSPDNPYLKRYTDTQASYTQNQQRLKELERYEQDPQAYLDLGKQQGWIEVEDPEASEFDDPRVTQMASRLEAAEQRLTQYETRFQAEDRAAGEELFHQDLDSWAGQDGVTLSKADHNAIFGMLMKAPDPTQEAAARQVYEAHVAHKKTEREQLEQEIREQMRRPRVPTPPTGGAAHTGVPNWSEMSEAEINEYMAARAAGSV